jgi:hypothetical protein
MKFGRFVTLVLGAAVGAALVIWWVRYRVPQPLPEGSSLDGTHNPNSGWIELK